MEGLTSWNSGEAFASLGIGHFIWYPKGVSGPYEESFPGLVRFLSANGVKTPEWLEGACPWNSRAEFQAAAKSEKMSELRKLLASTIRIQSRYLAQRMEKALPTSSKSTSLRPSPLADLVSDACHDVSPVVLPGHRHACGLTQLLAPDWLI